MRARLVEDDAMIGRAVAEDLQADGYAVDWVHDGKAAQTALLHDVDEICEACARSCEDIGGMEACVRACRGCTQSCRRMAAAADAALEA